MGAGVEATRWLKLQGVVNTTFGTAREQHSHSRRPYTLLYAAESVTVPRQGEQGYNAAMMPAGEAELTLYAVAGVGESRVYRLRSTLFFKTNLHFHETQHNV